MANQGSTTSEHIEDFMREHTVHAPANNLADQDCSICRESYDNEEHYAAQIVHIEGCTHIFGASCLVAWLESSPESKTCPMCRTIWMVQLNPNAPAPGRAQDDIREPNNTHGIDIGAVVDEWERSGVVTFHQVLNWYDANENAQRERLHRLYRQLIMSRILNSVSRESLLNSIDYIPQIFTEPPPSRLTVVARTGMSPEGSVHSAQVVQDARSLEVGRMLRSLLAASLRGLSPTDGLRTLDALERHLRAGFIPGLPSTPQGLGHLLPPEDGNSDPEPTNRNAEPEIPSGLGASRWAPPSHQARPRR